MRKMATTQVQLGLTQSEHGALDEAIRQHLRLEPCGMIKFDYMGTIGSFILLFIVIRSCV